MEHLKPPQIFSGQPSPSAGALTTRTAAIPNCSSDESLEYATLLLGSFRKADCADPEVFASAAVAIFSRYPTGVVRAVTDPHSGIAGRLKWFPTIYEIREACDIENTRRQRIEESEARVKAQFAERDRLAQLDPPARRKEFIKREMTKINAAFAAAEPARAPPLDIREMEECAEKDALRRKLDANISRLAADYRSSPCTLSDTARGTVAGRAGGAPA